MVSIVTWLRKKPCDHVAMRPFDRGFTLVELLVVVGMISILSAAILATLNPIEQVKKGRDSQRKSDLGQIQKALDAYLADWNVYPASLPFGAKWTVSGTIYMRKVPQDPSPSQAYFYAQQLSGQGFRLYAGLERCQPGKCNDPQACLQTGGRCPNAPSNANCGTNATCTYGVASSNLEP